MKQILLVMLAMSLCSCASIINGSRQDLVVSSKPGNARIIVDGVDSGKTPTVIELKRGQSHVLRIELEGYEPYEVTLEKSINGWVWGNILVGGLIGLAIDSGTGAMYEFDTSKVEAPLREKRAIANDKEASVTIILQKKKPLAGKKVGQLVRKTR